MTTNTKESLTHRLLKKLFKFNSNIRIKDIEFSIKPAVKEGGVFRKCATIYSPSEPPPYNEDNWYSKICSVVFLGFKVLSFSAVNKRS